MHGSFEHGSMEMRTDGSAEMNNWLQGGTHAGVEVPRRDDEAVEDRLDLVDEVRDGRRLRLRGC